MSRRKGGRAEHAQWGGAGSGEGQGGGEGVEKGGVVVG